MKNLLITVTAALAVALAACDRTPQIEGTWQGPMENFVTTGINVTANGLVSSLISPQITFIPDTANALKGNITINTEFNIVDRLISAPKIVTPYALSVSGTSSVDGKYTIYDEDNIIVSFDKNSLKVNIDPKSVSYAENILDGEQAPELDSIAPDLVSSFERILRPQLLGYYNNFNRIEDIKVKGNILELEIKDIENVYQKL